MGRSYDSGVVDNCLKVGSLEKTLTAVSNRVGTRKIDLSCV